MKRVLIEFIIIAIMLLMFWAGRLSVNPQINRVYVEMDSQLLSAIRSFHGSEADTILIIDNELCFNRNGVTISALTGDFLRFYDDNYLTKEK